MPITDPNHKTLLELAERSLEDDSMYIVDIEVTGQAAAPVIWVYADTDKGGISLDECAGVSRRLQTMIEAHELFGEKFTLNVSSPGLDRPLKVRRQYTTNKGRLAKVKFTDNGTVTVIEGNISKVDESGIQIVVGKDSKRLEYASIIETKIQPVF